MVNNKENNPKNYLSTSEVAEILGISRIAIFKRIKKGQIPAQKIGRAYAIAKGYIEELTHTPKNNVLTDEEKAEIDQAVHKTVTEYGETLRLLGKE